MPLAYVVNLYENEKLLLVPSIPRLPLLSFMRNKFVRFSVEYTIYNKLAKFISSKNKSKIIKLCLHGFVIGLLWFYTLFLRPYVMNQFLIRIDENKVLIQHIDQFQRIPNQEIKNYSEDEKRGFSDFNQSGDLLKVRFTSDIKSLAFDVRYFDFEIETTTAIQTYEFDKVKAAMRIIRKMEVKMDILRDQMGLHGELDLSQKVMLICHAIKVAGGTIDLNNDGIKSRKTFELRTKRDIGKLVSQIKKAQTPSESCRAA